jgi:hypothetical protein
MADLPFESESRAPREVELSNVSFNPSEFHKKGVGFMQNHQLSTLIQIKTTLKR